MKQSLIGKRGSGLTILFVMVVSIAQINFNVVYAQSESLMLWTVGDEVQDTVFDKSVYSANYISLNFADFSQIDLGNEVILATLENGNLVGAITYIRDDGMQVAGLIDGQGDANFVLTQIGNLFEATILYPTDEIGFSITFNDTGQILVAQDINNLICFDYKSAETEVEREPITESVPTSRSTIARTSVVPILNSRPESSKVLYLDFDGELVVHPDWNGGQPINALPPDYNDGDPGSFSDDELARLERIWGAVAEDFAIFDVNVTTDRSLYDAAATGERQQVIITDTKAWYPPTNFGVIGVALPRSFTDPSEDTPAWVWVFANTIQSSTVVSHEAGHTLELLHDRDVAPQFFGTVKWANIMAAATNTGTTNGSLTHWGDRDRNHSLFEDDIQTIGSGKNLSGVGFIEDEAGNTIATAVRAEQSQTGLINANGDVDVYYVDLQAGETVEVTLDPYKYQWANLDSQLMLRSPDGTVLATSNPEIGNSLLAIPLLNAAINVSVPTTGRYYIEVNGVGFSNTSYFYSNYGSIGNYTLTFSQPVIPEQTDINMVPIYYLLLLDDDNPQ